MQALETGASRTATPGESAVIDVSPSPKVSLNPAATVAATGEATVAATGEAAETAPAGLSATEALTSTGVPVATEPAASSPAPTATVAATPLPTVEVARPQLSSEESWRQQQVGRQPFEQVQSFRAPGKVLLWWFDPQTGQHVPLGWIGPEFQAQARFRLSGTWLQALEIPYNINQSFGLVLPEAILTRMRAAGLQTEGPEAWVDTYVFDAPDLLAQ